MPIAELDRTVPCVPVLRLYNLTDEQLMRLHHLMLVNGNDSTHELRSKAKAHLGEFDTHDGRAAVHFHSEETTEFYTLLSAELGIELPSLHTPAGN